MKNHIRSYPRVILFFVFIGLTLTLLWLGGSSLETPEAHAIEPTNPDELFANCRYGVSPLGSGQVPWVSEIGAGWYLTFGPTPPGTPPENGAEFAHVIRTQQDQDVFGGYLSTYTVKPPLTEAGLGNAVRSNPGALWLVGNEVDRGPDPDDLFGGQDHTFPDVYATAYHEVYNFIKERDPSARIAISALVQVTPGRLQYLDKVWDAYLEQFGSPMPVDVWNMHLYILPEVRSNGEPNGIANVALGTDLSLAKRESDGKSGSCPLDSVYCYAEHDSMVIFAEQVEDMRSWMKEHGQQQKPLIISEYSLLYPYVVEGSGCFLMDENGKCFTPERVTTFMENSFNYLNVQAKDPGLGYRLDDNRLVQQWMWFSVNYKGAGSASNLVEDDLSTLTMAGQGFKNAISNELPYRNLVIDEVTNPLTFTNGLTETSVSLSVSIRNNGNAKMTAPVTVTFFSDAARQNPIGGATIELDVQGCSMNAQSATVVWDGLAAGIHRFWVEIESSGNVNGTDNVGSGFVFVDPHQTFLPLVLRN